MSWLGRLLGDDTAADAETADPKTDAAAAESGANGAGHTGADSSIGAGAGRGHDMPSVGLFVDGPNVLRDEFQEKQFI